MDADFIDQLIADWQRELPDVDPEPMALVGRIILLGRALEQRINERLKHHGLIYTDFDVLATLRRSGAPYQATPTELRQSILLTSGAMTAALDRLERRRLLNRIPSPQDRRSMSAQLTKRGVKLAERLVALRFEEAAEVIALLPREQQSQSVRAMKLLLGRLQHE
ncbi:MAG: MarR family transcriptional regulator [Pseudomonadota bacterium]